MSKSSANAGPVTFGEKKVREREVKSNKPKGPSKAKRAKTPKAKPEPETRHVSSELAEVELRICDLACEIAETAAGLKGLRKRHADAVDSRNSIRHDDAKGQTRMPFEEYPRHDETVANRSPTELALVGVMDDEDEA